MAGKTLRGKIRSHPITPYPAHYPSASICVHLRLKKISSIASQQIKLTNFDIILHLEAKLKPTHATNSLDRTTRKPHRTSLTPTGFSPQNAPMTPTFPKTVTFKLNNSPIASKEKEFLIFLLPLFCELSKQQITRPKLSICQLN
jgi:hypothetical protein